MKFYWLKYCLSFYKILNIIKLVIYFIAKKFGFNLKNFPNPYFLSIEITNFCNLNCPACTNGAGKLKREKGFMCFDLYKKIIDENKKTLILIILHFQGEPFLHEDLTKFIDYAKKNKIFTMFSTNANLSENQILEIKTLPDKIIISLDGITQETYQKYRINGDINNVLSFLDFLKRKKNEDNFVSELQFIVFNHNQHEIKNLKFLKKKYLIDKLILKSAQIYNNQQIELLPKDIKYSRYKIKNGVFELKKSIKNSCKRVIFGNVITWNGDVVPCCFDKNAQFVFGNIQKENLKNIRNSEKYYNFVKQIFNQKIDIKICRNCTEN